MTRRFLPLFRGVSARGDSVRAERGTSRRRATAVFVLIAVGLTGCSQAAGDPGGGSPSPAVSSSPPSATASPSPTPSAKYKPASAEGPAENVPLPVMPAEAKVESKEGLLAFVYFWFSLVNYGYETGDTDPVRTSSGQGCLSCTTFYDSVEGTYSADGWVEGGSIELISAGSEFISTDEGNKQVIIAIKQAPMAKRDATGRVFESNQGNELSVPQILELRYTGDGWFVETLETIN